MPGPLPYTKQTLEGMPPGQTLEVISTDKTTKSSLPPYRKRSRDVLLKVETEGEEIRLFIRKQ